MTGERNLESAEYWERLDLSQLNNLCAWGQILFLEVCPRIEDVEV